MFQRLSSLALCTVLVNLACIAGACSTAETPAEHAATAVRAEAEATCIASFHRQRECTEAFLPALVDLRVRLDKPAGIAETANTGGRDALIAKAHEEWTEDSTDAAIERTCARMSSDDSAAAMTQAMNTCLAATACGEFVPCEIGVIEQRLSR